MCRVVPRSRKNATINVQREPANVSSGGDGGATSSAAATIGNRQMDPHDSSFCRHHHTKHPPILSNVRQEPARGYGMIIVTTTGALWWGHPHVASMTTTHHWGSPQRALCQVRVLLPDSIQTPTTSLPRLAITLGISASNGILVILPHYSSR